jgi:hypothetical protein
MPLMALPDVRRWSYRFLGPAPHVHPFQLKPPYEKLPLAPIETLPQSKPDDCCELHLSPELAGQVNGGASKKP